jgi:hypothetical protein
MKKLFCSLFLSLFIVGLFAQAEVKSVKADSLLSVFEQRVIALGKTIITDSLVENRLAAAAQLAKEFPVQLQESGSFSYPFDSVQTLSILYPSDSTFRIVTWQLYVDVDDYRYFGFIQTNEAKPKVIVLKDKSKDMEDVSLDYEVMTADNWYGALYYKMMSFETPEGMKHLLFGYDGYQFFNKRKLLEVLTVSNGQFVFGAPVLGGPDPGRSDQIKNRLLLQYAAGSQVTLNFDPELGMIIYDNLVPQSSINGRPAWVPDGSYKGFRLEKGLWIYVDRIFDQVSDTPPMPAPILGKGRKVDILGRERN